MFKKMVIVGFFGVIVLVNRDKLGTNFCDNWPRSAESALFIGFDKAGENQAERAGFEPAVRCYSYADLANRCFRPLSHLSGLYKSTKNHVVAQEDYINHFNSFVFG